MKNNSTVIHYIKKILYFGTLFLITTLCIFFSGKNQEITKQIQLQLIGIYSPFVKTLNFTLKPILFFENKKSNDYNLEIENTFKEVILNKTNALSSNIHNFNYVAKKQKYSIFLIKPTYYSSSGILTDIIFAKNKLIHNNLSVNLPVISPEGLFGRIASIDKKNILVVTIFNEFSNIPVYTKQSNIYGIASGTGTQIHFTHPYLDKNNFVEGELVLTSGENNLITSEIPVGVIKINKDAIVIKPFAKKRVPILGIIK